MGFSQRSVTTGWGPAAKPVSASIADLWTRRFMGDPQLENHGCFNTKMVIHDLDDLFGVPPQHGNIQSFEDDSC